MKNCFELIVFEILKKRIKNKIALSLDNVLLHCLNCAKLCLNCAKLMKLYVIKITSNPNVIDES